MPLDPEAQVLLDTLAAGPEIDPFNVPPAVMREGLKAGIETTYTNDPGGFHGFFGMTQAIPRARQAVDESCEALRRALRA